MRDFRDAKAMARSLRHGLTGHGLDLTHGQSLELTAKAFGYDNWNILAAKIEAAQHALAETRPETDKTLYCSFCGKSQHEVAKLIAGPNSFICDECVGLCNDIVEHGAVLALLEADAADGGEAAGYPKLAAFVAERSSEQLRTYLAKIERDLTRMRDALGAADAAIEARADGRPLERPFKDMSDEGIAKQRGRINKQLGGSVKIVELITRALEARE